MYELTQTDKAIDEQLGKSMEHHDTGRSRWPGMNYEQGVEAAILWLTGQTDEAPMED